jgi:hypothetical protein
MNIGKIFIVLAVLVLILFSLSRNISKKSEATPGMTNITTKTMKFECSALPGLIFDFPVFANWKYLNTETTQPEYCNINIQFPISAKISPNLPNILRILVFKTNNPSSLVSQVKLSGINKNNIVYTLYENNELRFKNNNETITIMIIDRYTFGGVKTGSMAINLPTKENGFDYDEFWKQVIESLDFNK